MQDPNSQKQAAPCGTWTSPLSAEDVTGGLVGLGGVAADGDTLYWLEARPSEQGRTVLVRRGADGKVQDLTPPPVNVATRVHEYGGGAFAVSDEKIIYSEKSDGSLWLIDGAKPARKIAAVEGCRYADFRFVPGTDGKGTDKIVCVREDHRNRKPTDPEAAIVLIDTAEGVDAAKNAGTVLTKGPDFLSSPRVSPDGKSLAWISWNHPDMPWDATQLHTAELTANGIANEKTVAGDKTREAVVQPEWSPAGELYFCTDRSGWWNIHKLDDNGDVQAVTSEPDGEIGGPHWVFGVRYFDFLPDGNLIADLSKDGTSRAVTVDEKTGKLTDLGLPPVGQCPALLTDAQGKQSIAYAASAPDAMAFIALGPLDRSSPDEVLRTAGPELLDKKDVSLGEAITFPTANGEEAHAFYYPPQSGSFKPQEEEKPPLIVMIHGGPTSSAQPGFSPQKQWWTSRGFAVVDVNYRGSTGYGRDYRQKLDGNWGIADVEDCVAAVNYLVKEGKADADRVAIRGGSAGGFTVLAALTSSDAFKAGASLYGVADLMLLAAETHKFESRYLDRLLGPLPAAEDIYKERSPINHLDKLTAGVIFFQGLDDKVVPPSQAQVMVDAMKKLGLPVSHVEFEGEGHGFRKAENQKAVLEKELAFYAKLFGFTPAADLKPANTDEKPAAKKPAGGKGPAK
ncbi:MAG: prolyl oligopeptidase family serine peptidase [Alphaproteobacteria bacterium]|nr:prolyl oligopeptidase family serine peptidase [Alphaproteobacteria bacterium]